MYQRLILSVTLAGIAAVSTGCGPGRTTAATQPTPAAFDPATSDEKALAATEAMVAQLGGPAAWDAIKQLQWEHKYLRDGKVTNWFKHAWDRWNGRHRFEYIYMDSVEKAEAEGKPDLIRSWVVMYDLFDLSSGFASQRGQAMSAADKERTIGQANERWQHDSYQLAMLHKLRDPGVKLTYTGEVADVEGLCKPGCLNIKVEFVPEVGDDVYYVNINKETNMPEIMEMTLDSGVRIGYSLEGWTEVAGVKFPTVFTNVGMPSEVFQVENIRAGEPDDSLYIPQVR